MHYWLKAMPIAKTKCIFKYTMHTVGDQKSNHRRGLSNKNKINRHNSHIKF